MAALQFGPGEMIEFFDRLPNELCYEILAPMSIFQIRRFQLHLQVARTRQLKNTGLHRLQMLTNDPYLWIRKGRDDLGAYTNTAQQYLYELAKHRPSTVSDQYETPERLLARSVELRDLEMVNYFLASGTDPTDGLRLATLRQDDDFVAYLSSMVPVARLPLEEAFRTGRLDYVIRFLPSAAQRDGSSLKLLAMASGRYEQWKPFLTLFDNTEYLPDPDDTKMFNALISGGEVEMARDNLPEVLEIGTSSDPYELAGISQSMEIFDLLLEHEDLEDDQEEIDRRVGTALWSAVVNHPFDLDAGYVELLRSRGKPDELIEAKISGYYGRIPSEKVNRTRVVAWLQGAILGGRIDLVRRLHQSYPNIPIEKVARNELLRAQSVTMIKLVDSFVQGSGVNKGIIAQDGLEVGIQQCSLSMVDYFLRRGATIRASSLNETLSRGSTHIYQYLLKWLGYQLPDPSTRNPIPLYANMEYADGDESEGEEEGDSDDEEDMIGPVFPMNGYAWPMPAVGMMRFPGQV